MRRKHTRVGRILTAALLSLAFVGGSAATGVSSVEAGSKKKAAAKQSKSKHDKRLDTRTLFGLEWHDDWRAAVLANRLDPRDQRPIFHLRILGDLAAKT